MDQKRKEFCVEIVNTAFFNHVMDDWAKVKESSHSKYTGWIFLWNLEDLDDPEKELYKVKPGDIDKSLDKICNNRDCNFSPEIESNVLYSNKYLDASLLEPDSINAIMQLASIGEVMEV